MNVQDILKSKNIIKVKAEDSLASALKLLNSSHDSAFVFDKKKFLGVVNPYYSLIKKSYPANAKALNALIHPPKLTHQMGLAKAAKLMIESKLHYLPVFKGDEFLGIVSARRIMKHHKDSDKLNITLQKFILKKQPKIQTIKETDFLSSALSVFKKNKISKLVVTGQKGKLTGILAYYDIIDYLTEPREKPRISSRQGSKQSTLKKAVKIFQKKHVITLTGDKTLKDAVEQILEKGIGSVIVVGKDQKPLGIITTQDILKTVTTSPRPVLAQLHGINLSKTSKRIAESFTDHLSTMLRKTHQAVQADVTVKEKKDGGLYEAILSVVGPEKRKFTIKGEDNDLGRILTDLKKKARTLLRKEKNDA